MLWISWDIEGKHLRFRSGQVTVAQRQSAEWLMGRLATLIEALRFPKRDRLSTSDQEHQPWSHHKKHFQSQDIRWDFRDRLVLYLETVYVFSMRPRMHTLTLPGANRTTGSSFSQWLGNLGGTTVDDGIGSQDAGQLPKKKIDLRWPSPRSSLSGTEGGWKDGAAVLFFLPRFFWSIRHGKSIENQRCTRHVFFWLGCAYWKVLEAGSSLINFFVDRSLYNESPDGKIVITTVWTRNWRYSTFLPVYFWNHFSLLCISWCHGVLQWFSLTLSGKVGPHTSSKAMSVWQVESKGPSGQSRWTAQQRVKIPFDRMHGDEMPKSMRSPRF